MADKATQLLLDALRRAAAEPAGAPLCGTRSAPGLFPSTAVGRRVAQQAREAGSLQLLRTEKTGRTSREIHELTDAGLAFLLAHTPAEALLEALIAAMSLRSQQLDVLRQRAQRCQAALGHAAASEPSDSLRMAAHRKNGAATTHPCGISKKSACQDQVLTYLRHWQEENADKDCPLPELYREACSHSPGLTPGQFHDGLRELHAEERIYLHPWTGPLHEIPEPALALLSGHAVCFYVSLQENKVAEST